jgi:Ca-activated chloride channel family protein
VSFTWPWVLLALLLAPLAVWLYLRGLERPAESALVHPDLKLLLAARGHGRSFRRHLPALLYLLALVLSVLALARPNLPLPVPDDRTTVVLTMDTSLSMGSRDVKPNRITAAERAAAKFVKALPSGAKVGLVSFSSYAVTEVPPTADHQRVLDGLAGLNLGQRTAIGAGLAEALKDLPGQAPGSSKPPPAAIVLLSDGRNNFPPDPFTVATQAKKVGVKVYTIGLGTPGGTLDFFRGFGGGGRGGFVVGFDADTLKMIASITGGSYFEAHSAGKLASIYRKLGRSIGWTVKETEVTSWVALLAAAVLLISGSVAASTRRVL